MSYKLVGNEYTKIRQYQKKRVRKLLSEHIPAEEVICMRDGRFACSVCDRRPVFDTVTMLSLHRKGKKHSQSAHQHLKQSLRGPVILHETSNDTVHSLPPLLAQTQQAINQTTTTMTTLPPHEPKDHQPDGCGRGSRCGDVTPTTSKVNCDANNDDKVPIDNQYMKLRSEGWLVRSDGQWYKDPNVEFDSDDDNNDGDGLH